MGRHASGIGLPSVITMVGAALVVAVVATIGAMALDRGGDNDTEKLAAEQAAEAAQPTATATVTVIATATATATATKLQVAKAIKNLKPGDRCRFMGKIVYWRGWRGRIERSSVSDRPNSDTYTVRTVFLTPLEPRR